jgi:hypothetical protein
MATAMSPSFRLRLQPPGRGITVCVTPRDLATTRFLAQIVSPTLREQLSKGEFHEITKGFELSWAYRDKLMRYIIIPTEGVLADARFRAVLNVVLEGQIVTDVDLNSEKNVKVYRDKR